MFSQVAADDDERPDVTWATTPPLISKADLLQSTAAAAAPHGTAPRGDNCAGHEDGSSGGVGSKAGSASPPIGTEQPAHGSGRSGSPAGNDGSGKGAPAGGSGLGGLRRLLGRARAATCSGGSAGGKGALRPAASRRSSAGSSGGSKASNAAVADVKEGKQQQQAHVGSGEEVLQQVLESLAADSTTCATPGGWQRVG